jgi:heme/copper-type cytochrome/quinol oxidase subunit 3
MSPGRPSRLWWWFVVANAVFFAVWIGWFVLAARHPVAEVPLATQGRP